jgi:Lon protease-like protein
MRRLPLFPLPVVLFPGAVTPLHIFEPRYRQMVARCLEFDRRFGLVYHDPDRLGPFDPSEERVGTVARIGEFRILPDGRSLLLAHGEERFRIVDGIESETAFFEALVEPLEEDGEREGDASAAASEALMDRRRRTLDLLETVLDQMVARGMGPEGALAARPTLDPAEEVSFPVAAMIRTDPYWQHLLLELDREEDRLERIDALLRDALG